MLFQLKTGQVSGYDEGQEAFVYLVSTAQAVAEAGLSFVFTDGHAYAAFSSWFDDLDGLPHVDWQAAASRYWGSRTILLASFNARNRRNSWFMDMCLGS